eukprot:TRINITY_DN9518_c0_g3_i1.p1 TRINITY_DN9518_c0_g3~~TRINITY_DN9518_c0_g3_i1.p1  ORF type:complete len:1095 (-),score=131.42 TRINITY_DN9518_c0_g3_i1:261-3515(-)
MLASPCPADGDASRPMYEGMDSFGTPTQDAITNGLKRCIERHKLLLETISTIQKQAEHSLEDIQDLIGQDEASRPSALSGEIGQALQPLLQKDAQPECRAAEPCDIAGLGTRVVRNTPRHSVTQPRHSVTQPMCSTHFFLSHYQENGGDQVATLQLELEALGFLSWLDTKAENINIDGMMQGINEASVFLLFLTKGALSRPYVQLEVRHALARGKPFVLVHEDDKRKGAFDFDKSEIPADLHHVIDNIESIPYRRRRWEANAMLRRIIASGGFEMGHEDSNTNEVDKPWPASIETRFRTRRRGRRSYVKRVISSESEQELDEELEVLPPQPFHFWQNTLDPHGTVALVLDVCSLIVLLYELLVYPYLLAHSLPGGASEKVPALATALFWLTLIFFSAKTGFVTKGVVEMRPRKCLVNYLTGWFLFDAGLVVLDLYLALQLIIQPSNIFLNFVKFSRVFRFARVLKLVTLIRSSAHWFDSRVLVRSLAPLSFLGFALMMAHLFACFNIVLTGSDGFGSDHVAPHYLILLETYAGRMLSNALNQSHRLSADIMLSLLSLILGMLINSCCVSTIGLHFASDYIDKVNNFEKVRRVSSFLSQHNVARATAQRVKRGCWARLISAKDDDPSWTEVLLCLPPLVQRDLLWEVFAPHITKQPFFLLWSRIAVSPLQELCAVGVREKTFGRGQVVFEVGAEANETYVVRQGRLHYDMDLSMYLGADERAAKKCSVVDGAWISEAALWSKWFHTGTLFAADTCSLIAIDATTFIQFVEKNIEMKEIAHQYGAHFLQRIVEATANWPSDLEVVATDYVQIVVNLTADIQARIGIDAIATLKSSMSLQLFHQAALRELETEVLDGRSILLQTRTGVVERITSVSVLSLSCEDGERLLYQIAKFDDNKISLSGKMIASKVKRGEEPSLTAKRLVEKNMESLKDDITFGNATLHVQRTESDFYGVDTKYLRTVQHAHLRGPRRGWRGTSPVDVLSVLQQTIAGPQASTESGRQVRVSPGLVAFVNRHLDDVFMDASGIYAWVHDDFSITFNDLFAIPANTTHFTKILNTAKTRVFDVSGTFSMRSSDSASDAVVTPM